jgi:hypothetical protein
MAAASTPPTPTISGASTSDILTALKNIVLALNNATQTYLNVNGTLTAANITTPTVVKSSAGRIARLSVIVAGTAPGMIYDGATLTARTKPLGVIPNSIENTIINLATSFGLLVVPGAGQTVTVGYS